MLNATSGEIGRARHIEKTPIHASWDACLPHSDLWIAAVDVGKLKEIQKGESLYSQGQVHRRFYLIRSGFIQAAMVHSNGRRVMLDLMGPGTLFGEAAAFEGSGRCVSTWAVTDARVSVYTPCEISGLGERAMPFLESIIKIMATKQHVLAQKLLEFSSGDPEQRLRNLLARIANVQARAAGPDDEAARRIWLSQERLGEMCGMSRISAARALKKLNAQKVVRTHPRFVEILDIERLS